MEDDEHEQGIEIFTNPATRVEAEPSEIDDFEARVTKMSIFF